MVPREGKRYAKADRRGSNLRRHDATEELDFDANAFMAKIQEEREAGGPSESVSASSDDSAYSKDDGFDDLPDELEHEKKQGKRYANVNKKSSNLARHNMLDRLPTVKISEFKKKDAEESSEEDE